MIFYCRLRNGLSENYYWGQKTLTLSDESRLPSLCSKIVRLSGLTFTS